MSNHRTAQLITTQSSSCAVTRYGAIYARVSTEDQGKGYSIPTQIDACQRLAQQHGYHVPASHIFIDEGISGTTLDRPALHHMRALIATQAVAAVIVLDPDRLSRKMGKLLVLTDELQAADIPLLCVSHPVEAGPEGMLFFQMRGVIAEYEREKTLERTKRGKLGRIASGYHGGGGIPMGYRYISEPHKGRFEIDEEEAAVVRRIFAMYLDGMNMRGIAFQLTTERIPTKMDRQPVAGRKKASRGTWSTSALASILNNEAYTGQMHYNKTQAISKTRSLKRDRSEWLTIAVPVIIPQNIFDAVEQKRCRNKALSKRNRQHEYLFLVGRLRCGRCQLSMFGSPNKRMLHYRCSTAYRHHPDEPFCRGGVRAPDIEGPVWQAIARALSDPTIITAELDRQAQQEAHGQGERAKESQAIQKALASLEREAQRWDEAYGQAVIDIVELKAKKLDITDRRQRLLTQQEEVETAIHAVQQDQARRQDILTYCLRVKERLHTMDMPHKREALEALDIRVFWAPGEPIRIKGSIPIDVTASTAPGPCLSDSQPRCSA